METFSNLIPDDIEVIIKHHTVGDTCDEEQWEYSLMLGVKRASIVHYVETNEWGYAYLDLRTLTWMTSEEVLRGTCFPNTLKEYFS